MLESVVVGRDRVDLIKYGDRYTINLGKLIVGEEEYMLTNPVRLDVLRPHLILIVGKRGSGKSYTGGVIAEELLMLGDEIRERICSILIDTMGIFWSMKYPNDRDFELLLNWKMRPHGFKDVRIFIPRSVKSVYEKGDIAYDGVISIKPSELTLFDWLNVLKISIDDERALILSRALKRLSSINFSIDDLKSEIESDEEFEDRVKRSLLSKLEAVKEWQVFSEEGFDASYLLEGGYANVVDFSMIERDVACLILAVLCRKIYQERVRARRIEERALMSGEKVKTVAFPWIIIDEAHEYLPSNSVTPATQELIRLIRQGRQPGISLVFITQMPNKLHSDAIAQADLVIAHRLTAKSDIDALSAIMQTYLTEDIRKSVSSLPTEKGVAVLLDDNSERLIRIKVRPRISWHAGASPAAIE